MRGSISGKHSVVWSLWLVLMEKIRYLGRVLSTADPRPTTLRSNNSISWWLGPFQVSIVVLMSSIEGKIQHLGLVLRTDSSRPPTLGINNSISWWLDIGNSLLANKKKDAPGSISGKHSVPWSLWLLLREKIRHLRLILGTASSRPATLGLITRLADDWT